MTVQRRTETEPQAQPRTSQGGDVSAEVSAALPRQRRRCPPALPPPSLPLPDPPSTTTSASVHLLTPPISSSSIASMASFHPNLASTPTSSPTASQSWTTTSSPSSLSTAAIPSASRSPSENVHPLNTRTILHRRSSTTPTPFSTSSSPTAELVRISEALPASEDTLRRVTADAHAARTRASLLHQSATDAVRRANALEEQARREREWARDLVKIAEGGEREARVAEEAVRQASEVLTALRRIAIEEVGEHLARSKVEENEEGVGGSSSQAKQGNQSQLLSSVFPPTASASSNQSTHPHQANLIELLSHRSMSLPATWPQGSSTHLRDRTITQDSFNPRVADLDLDLVAILSAEQDRIASLHRQPSTGASTPVTSTFSPRPFPLTPQIGPQPSPQPAMRNSSQLELPPAHSASEYLLRAAMMGRSQSNVIVGSGGIQRQEGWESMRASASEQGERRQTSSVTAATPSTPQSSFHPFSLLDRNQKASTTSAFDIETGATGGGGEGGLGLMLDANAVPLSPGQHPPRPPRLSSIDLPIPSSSTPSPPQPYARTRPSVDSTPSRASVSGAWWKQSSPVTSEAKKKELELGFEGEGDDEVEDDPLVPFPVTTSELIPMPVPSTSSSSSTLVNDRGSTHT
ncbi:hypothetical protein CF319_g4391 [Tilletia indica]|uniref:Uncharacterized protein n=1 Tax=Tilletia indica TaxID=43049 RepID=A0A177TU86_9BASI|nr:hypothetical protein CF319_g4391 [Tilletia indica]KAE8254817.1 hypothetical protein A4X13_0g3268 [Tilletia indica]